ncbi:hypothetical protein N825_25295 [Skermanella stibiiresistens SB22]|uniref:Uncharacterized protein n=1 Tax=Skermanella stibiiresistens SB22 TaxID=1385369 RepID=W9GWD3_9PROT|nr:hypothetical protein N825_25295 [Skermanella stibiiresistens SB22]
MDMAQSAIASDIRLDAARMSAEILPSSAAVDRSSFDAFVIRAFVIARPIVAHTPVLRCIWDAKRVYTHDAGMSRIPMRKNTQP